jgi:hypothetical protein
MKDIHTLPAKATVYNSFLKWMNVQDHCTYVRTFIRIMVALGDKELCALYDLRGILFFTVSISNTQRHEVVNTWKNTFLQRGLTDDQIQSPLNSRAISYPKTTRSPICHILKSNPCHFHSFRGLESDAD